MTIAFLSGSRGGAFALIGGIILCIIFNSKRILSFKSFFVVIIIVFAAYISLMNLSDSLLECFTIESVINSGGSERTKIWGQAFEVFEKSSFLRKLLGYGIGNTIACFSHYRFNIINVMHNMFIQSLLEIGLIGLVVYIVMVFSFLKQAFILNDKFAFGVICCMIIMSLSTSISTFKPYLNIMPLILCSKNYMLKQEVSSKVCVNNEIFNNSTSF